MKNEQQKLAELLDKGYKIQVINPFAENFNEKYFVYQEISEANIKLVLVDKEGNVVGFQG